MWWGGFAIGPRYLLPMLPFMALSVIFVFREWGAQLWLRALTPFLALWSLIATWGLTLAEQAFPSDAIRNPLLEYAWPNWLAGNIARNTGTLLGLQGVMSLMPLGVALVVIGAGWWMLHRRGMGGYSPKAVGALGGTQQPSGSHG
jgi:branched-subunit amino acid ABC-type transport system permease component